MAGNSVSIMGITTKGRGGRQRETNVPDNFHLSVQRKRKTKCRHCNTILPRGAKYCLFCGKPIEKDIVDRRLLKREATIQPNPQISVHKRKKEIDRRPYWRKGEVALLTHEALRMSYDVQIMVKTSHDSYIISGDFDSLTISLNMDE